EPKMASMIFQKLQREQRGAESQTKVEGLQARIPVIEGKIQALLDRLTELPKGVPGTVIYQEIERLDAERKTALTTIHELERDNCTQEPVKQSDYERLLVQLLRMVNSEGSAVNKKAVVTALIHRVQIKEKGFELAYYMGSGQIKTGEAIASPAFLLGKKVLSDSSLRLKNGGP